MPAQNDEGSQIKRISLYFELLCLTNKEKREILDQNIQNSPHPIPMLYSSNFSMSRIQIIKIGAWSTIENQLILYVPKLWKLKYGNRHIPRTETNNNINLTSRKSLNEDSVSQFVNY